MSAPENIFYFACAIATFVVATWIEDPVMQGFSIGVITMIGLFNIEPIAATTSQWVSRKLQ